MPICACLRINPGNWRYNRSRFCFFLSLCLCLVLLLFVCLYGVVCLSDVFMILLVCEHVLICSVVSYSVYASVYLVHLNTIRIHSLYAKTNKQTNNPKQKQKSKDTNKQTQTNPDNLSHTLLKISRTGYVASISKTYQNAQIVFKKRREIIMIHFNRP